LPAEKPAGLSSVPNERDGAVELERANAGLLRPDGASARLLSGSGSAGCVDFRKASRDINPRWGAGDGEEAADGLIAGEKGALALGAAGEEDDDLRPDESSAMILRIEARISSMLGSAVDSSLDIPYLFAIKPFSLTASRTHRANLLLPAVELTEAPPRSSIVAGCGKSATISRAVIPGERRSQGGGTY